MMAIVTMKLGQQTSDNEAFRFVNKCREWFKDCLRPIDILEELRLHLEKKGVKTILQKSLNNINVA